MREDRSARRALTVGGLAASVALLGCAAPPALSEDDERVQVVATTGLIADLVSQVGGDDVNVVSLVPDGADARSYEPTLRGARDVVYADLAFSNYPMLEQRGLIRLIDANLPDDATHVSLAEESVKYAAEIIPLVERPNLDTIWLGLSARGTGEEPGVTSASDVLFSATGAAGPGRVVGYLTGSFGEPQVYFDSGDGFDAADGYRDDTAVLPVDAHTHMSWSFSEPGVYTVDLAARLQVDATSRPVPVGEATVTFAVGVPAAEVGDGRRVLSAGHADITADLDRSRVVVHHDEEGGHGAAEQHDHAHDHGQAPAGEAPEDVVIEVPPKALVEVPADERLDFLGSPGTPVYQLPQAVLGKHVHGEIDPHLWQDVGNAMAYVELIRDALVEADPEDALDYRDRADAYLGELAQLDQEVRRTIGEVAQVRRYLVTTYDAFAYLARAYDLEVAGFVAANPATESSLADRRRVVETIRTLRLPAVFAEPGGLPPSPVLTQIAAETGARICTIYDGSLDDEVTSYVQLMRFNARSIQECLS